MKNPLRKKTFADITASFTKPIADLQQYVADKRDAANAAHIRSSQLQAASAGALALSADLHNDADKAQAFQNKLEQFLNN